MRLLELECRLRNRLDGSSFRKKWIQNVFYSYCYRDLTMALMNLIDDSHFFLFFVESSIILVLNACLALLPFTFFSEIALLPMR